MNISTNLLSGGAGSNERQERCSIASVQDHQIQWRAFGNRCTPVPAV
ncbi:hypothetical protein [uncultured Roseovarius sp.]|nr:hypothetical protein [uncultured Roseovarius sp.]